MYVTIRVSDLQDIHVNRPCRAPKDNQESSIIYRDGQGKYHKIDLAVCAENYAKERGIDHAACTCVGERDIIEGYFEFWTSGIHTRIVFPKRHPLEWKEFKIRRFHAFQRLLSETGYTTLDLT